MTRSHMAMAMAAAGLALATSGTSVTGTDGAGLPHNSVASVISVDASHRLLNGTAIAPTMAGCALETLNHQLVGGLYSQVIWGESFEEPAGLDNISGSAPTFNQTGRYATAYTTVTWQRAPTSAPDAVFTHSTTAMNGAHSQLLRVGQGSRSSGSRLSHTSDRGRGIAANHMYAGYAGLVNRGLDGQGLYLQQGATYTGYLFARAASSDSGVPAQRLSVSLWDTPAAGTGTAPHSTRTHSPGQDHVHGHGSGSGGWVNLTVRSGGEWQRLNFTVTAPTTSTCYNTSTPRNPCGAAGPGHRIGGEAYPAPPEHECIECTGVFMLALHTQDTAGVLVDQVFMEQVVDEGRFQGMHVREDLAQALVDEKIRALRLGGSACMVPQYQWRRFRGPAWEREPYAGDRYACQSAGFDMFEVLDLAEAAGIKAVALTLNPNVEDEQSVADFVEYNFGGVETALGRLRAQDGHPHPRRAFLVQFGNDEEWHPIASRPTATTNYVARFANLTRAMDHKAHALGLPFNLTYGLEIRPNGSYINYTAGESLLAREMLHTLAFLGNRVRWDWHVQIINYDDPAQPPEQCTTVPTLMRDLVQSAGSQVKLAVFEEDGAYYARVHGHDLARGLAHARMANALVRIGDFAVWEAPVLCVEPMARDDNGYDQGQTMYTPNASWGSPQYHVAKMVASAYLPWLVDTTTTTTTTSADTIAAAATAVSTADATTANTASSSSSAAAAAKTSTTTYASPLDVVAVANSNASHLFVRVVNPSPSSVNTTVSIHGLSHACKEVIIVAVTLASPAADRDKLNDINTLANPCRICPITTGT